MKLDVGQVRRMILDKRWASAGRLRAAETRRNGRFLSGEWRRGKQLQAEPWLQPAASGTISWCSLFEGDSEFGANVPSKGAPQAMAGLRYLHIAERGDMPHDSAA